MKKVKAIIERAKDGTFSIYMDDETLDYLVTGTGKTVEAAKACFEGGYADTRRYYEEEGKAFEEAEFEYAYDTATFLSECTKAFTLAGLSRMTGINPGQLSHYATGRRAPSARTKRRMEEAMHAFAASLGAMRLA